MISKFFRKKWKTPPKEKTFPVQEIKKQSVCPGGKVLVRYTPTDEAYATPLRILLEQENISYVDSVQHINECFMVFNIVTSHTPYVANEPVMVQAQKNGTRIINIIFVKRQQASLELIGENIWVDPKDINDYILSPLLCHAPYNKSFHKKRSEVLEQMKSILHGLVVSPHISIGEDAVIGQTQQQKHDHVSGHDKFH